MLICIVCVFSKGARAAVHFDDETLKYVVSYKWGLIHKDAGEATVTLRKNGKMYDIKLVAHSKPWADRIYRVRDTLITRMRVSDFKPTYYVKRMHEKDKHDIDEVHYSYSGSTVTGNVIRHRNRASGKTVTKTTLTANGPVYDFLSIFYYLRRLDYSNMNKYTSYIATVFSGDKKETVKIKCLGISTIKLRYKSNCQAYHLKFNFTQKGGKKSSDDIDCWISTDPSHTPISIVGKLPVGEVRVNLVSGWN